MFGGLPRHALLSLIGASVVRKVDYCCSVLAGVSRQLLYRLLRQAFGAHLLLRELHWLRVQERITFRLCVLTHRCLNGSAPAYLAENIRLTADVESRRHSTVVHNNNACRSAGAEIYPR